MPPETPDETGPDPVLDPATAPAVRRLLADARHDEPTPPAVVARLDATLAGLRAERAASPAPGPSAAPPGLPPRPSGDAPIDLASHRRRRRGTLLLAAAAAVVVVGVGGVVVPQLGGSGDSSVSSDADSSPESQGDAGAGQAPQQPAPDGNAEEEPSPALPDRTVEDRIVAAADELAAYEGLLLADGDRSLSTVSLDADLAALLGAVAADPDPADPTRCDVEPAAGALGVVTTLDGESVVVEVTPTAGGAGVRVLGCDGEPLVQEQYGAR